MKTSKLIAAILALVLTVALAATAFASPEPPSGEPSGGPSIEPVTFPDDAKIVSATAYSIYTKNPDSLQDAVIKATLYWDTTNDKVYEIRFLQAMLPWDDNDANAGWANMTDENVLAALGDAVISFEGDAHGTPVPCNFAKYIQIGDIVWTGELGSDPACDTAVVYSADIGGQTVTLLDYVSTQEGAAWYHEAAQRLAFILPDPAPAPAPSDPRVALALPITYKETNGHGVYFWLSDITFPGNMAAIKQFVIDNGFDYDYYADGGITQNEDGYWQTVDAVSGATLDETPTYLDLLKTLYGMIQAGDCVAEN